MARGKMMIRLTHFLVAALLVLLGISRTTIASPAFECGRYSQFPGKAVVLSVADVKGLNEQRKAFSHSTRDLCEDICSNELKLQTELAMKIPNAKNATTLQAEISKLKSNLNRKRLIYLLWKTKTRFNAFFK